MAQFCCKICAPITPLGEADVRRRVAGRLVDLAEVGPQAVQHLQMLTDVCLPAVERTTGCGVPSRAQVGIWSGGIAGTSAAQPAAAWLNMLQWRCQPSRAAMRIEGYSHEQ